jgi:hypothetical protein
MLFKKPPFGPHICKEQIKLYDVIKLSLLYHSSVGSKGPFILSDFYACTNSEI